MDPVWIMRPPSHLFICAKYLLLEATGFSLPQYQAWQIGDTCSGEPLSP